MAPGAPEGLVAFRDMPERSYPKVARALAQATTLSKRWASEDGWQERVRAWDAEVDQRRREEFAAAAVDASREQAETAARIRLGVDAFARTFLDELAQYREREDPVADLSPSQKLAKLGAAARALQHVQQVERLARVSAAAARPVDTAARAPSRGERCRTRV